MGFEPGYWKSAAQRILYSTKRRPLPKLPNTPKQIEPPLPPPGQHHTDAGENGIRAQLLEVCSAAHSLLNEVTPPPQTSEHPKTNRITAPSPGQMPKITDQDTPLSTSDINTGIWDKFSERTAAFGARCVYSARCSPVRETPVQVCLEGE